MLPVATIFY
ncbi:hypothetical protein EC82524_3062A, partial [Escherichia coli 8.2524]